MPDSASIEEAAVFAGATAALAPSAAWLAAADDAAFGGLAMSIADCEDASAAWPAPDAASFDAGSTAAGEAASAETCAVLSAALAAAEPVADVSAGTAAVLEAPAATVIDSIFEVADDCGAAAAAAGALAAACPAAALSAVALSAVAELDAAAPTAVAPTAAASPGVVLGADALATAVVPGADALATAAAPAGDALVVTGGGDIGAAAAGGETLPVDGKGAPPLPAGAPVAAPLLWTVLPVTWCSVPAKSDDPVAALPELVAPAAAGACSFEGAALMAGAAGARKFGIVAFMP